jgi:hypothetical protein
MIKSLWRITFTPSTGPRAGEEIVLLDHGDLMEAEPTLPAAQNVAQTSPLFSPWGHTAAMGGAKTSAAWTRRRLLASLPRTQAMLDQLTFPWGDSGTLKVAILDGATFAWDRSAVQEITPTFPELPGAFLLQTYTASCGPMRLVAGPLPEGLQALWPLLLPGTCQDWENINTDWDDILTTPIS